MKKKELLSEVCSLLSSKEFTSSKNMVAAEEAFVDSLQDKYSLTDEAAAALSSSLSMIRAVATLAK